MKLTLLLLVFPFLGYSQTADLTMSLVAHIDNTASYGSIINSSSKSGCIEVETGLYASSDGSYGEFSADCSFEFQTLKIKLFPNPAKDYTNLQIVHPYTPKDITYEITGYDLLGHQLFNLKKSEQSLYDGVKIDLSSLSSGAFFIKVASWNFNKTFKVIKVQ